MGTGEIVAEATLEGASASVDARGRVQATLDSLAVRGYPEPIRGVALTANLDGRDVKVETILARIGDGEKEASLFSQRTVPLPEILS